MSERIDYSKLTPEGYRAMSELERYVRISLSMAGTASPSVSVPNRAPTSPPGITR